MLWMGGGEGTPKTEGPKVEFGVAWSPKIVIGNTFSQSQLRQVVWRDRLLRLRGYGTPLCAEFTALSPWSYATSQKMADVGHIRAVNGSVVCLSGPQRLAEIMIHLDTIWAVGQVRRSTFKEDDGQNSLDENICTFREETKTRSAEKQTWIGNCKYVAKWSTRPGMRTFLVVVYSAPGSRGNNWHLLPTRYCCRPVLGSTYKQGRMHLPFVYKHGRYTSEAESTPYCDDK